MLKLSIEKPTKVSSNGRHGWARYRIDFGDLTDDYYILGWITPLGEAREFLYNIKGWREGLIKEIYQTDLFHVQRFQVRLYRAGVIPEDGGEPEVTLLEEKEFGAQVPLD